MGQLEKRYDKGTSPFAIFFLFLVEQSKVAIIFVLFVLCVYECVHVEARCCCCYCPFVLVGVSGAGGCFSPIPTMTMDKGQRDENGSHYPHMPDASPAPISFPSPT